MMPALLSILGAVLPPLMKAIADLIEQYAQGKIDHNTAVAQLTQALTDGQASIAQLNAALAASDADFQAQLQASKKP